MMTGRVILVEGLDLAGKTTLVHNLETELKRRGYTVRVSRNALCPENPIAALADQIRRDPDAELIETAALFLAAQYWDERHFTPPPDGTIHLQDSCWLRSLAYHTWKETFALPEQIARAGRYLRKFDAAVFLTAGIEERQRRLAERERNEPGINDVNDHLVETDPDGFLRLEHLLWGFTQVYSNATKLDTTGVPSELLVPAAINKLIETAIHEGQEHHDDN